MDISAIATQLASSAIVGLVTWLGGLLLQQLKSSRSAANALGNGLGQELGADLGRVAVATGEAAVQAARSGGAVHIPYGAAVPLPVPVSIPTPVPAAPPVWSAPTPASPASTPLGRTVGPMVPGAPGFLQGFLPPAPPAVNRSVNIRAVALHVAALQFGINVVGFFVALLVGLLFGATNQSSEFFLLIQAPLGTLFLAAGFFVIALTVERTLRWRHLTYVALGTAAATLLVNALLGARATTLAAFLFAVCVALFQTFLAMGCGGLLAALVSGEGVGKRGARPMEFAIAARPTVPAVYSPSPTYARVYPTGPYAQPAQPHAPAYPAYPSAVYGHPQYPPAAAPVPPYGWSQTVAQPGPQPIGQPGPQLPAQLYPGPAVGAAPWGMPPAPSAPPASAPASMPPQGYPQPVPQSQPYGQPQLYPPAAFAPAPQPQQAGPSQSPTVPQSPDASARVAGPPAGPPHFQPW